MTLDLAATLASRSFDVALRVEAGTTLAVLGPNGAGKSTLVDIVAGLLDPDSGRATLEGTTLFDSARRIDLPPHRRRISLLSQDPLLFPHLSVLENVAFGPRSTGTPAGAARTRARTWLAAVDASDLVGRRPAELSGGQAQRVALARALAPQPDLLLLDEPMAALDASVAPELRRMLRAVLAERTTVLITHDVLDAFTLADRVVVLREGRIVEEGLTREVLERPQTRFTAEVAGLNLLTGISTGSGLRDDRGREVDLLGAQAYAVGAPIAATFRPTSVSVRPASGSPAIRGRIRSVIRDIEPRGDVLRIRSDLVSADLTPAALAALMVTVGDSVDFAIDTAAVSVYPRR